MARSVAPSSAQCRALAALHQPRMRDPHLGAILCPSPLTVDAWEELAVPQQQRLMLAAGEDRDDERRKGSKE